MTNYTNVKIHLSEGQLKKIEKAISEKTGVSIELSHPDFNGEHALAVTNTQMNKISKAYEDVKGVVLKLSKKQLMYNAKTKKGGFPGALLPFLGSARSFLASKVIPSTGLLTVVGAATGNNLINKIAGNGIDKKRFYKVRNGEGIKFTKIGGGLFMSPWKIGGSLGDGLYLNAGNGYVRTGAGLLLGPNSPFANIPFLKLIL